MQVGTISLEMLLTVIIIPALTYLAAVIRILWRKNENHVKEVVRLWEECEADRRKTANDVLKLTKEVGQLGGYEKGVQALAETLVQHVGHHSHDEDIDPWDGIERRSTLRVKK